MAGTDIVEEIKKLPVVERLRVVAAAVELVREDLRRMGAPERTTEKKQRLAAAALAADYAAGSELTAFTSLDSEDFGAQG